VTARYRIRVDTVEPGDSNSNISVDREIDEEIARIVIVSMMQAEENRRRLEAYLKQRAEEAERRHG
jgi:hypothetical protein